jgi:hypothetical protein
MTALIVIVAVGMAIGLISAAILYFYPAIISMPGEKEDGEQELIIGNGRLLAATAIGRQTSR